MQEDKIVLVSLLMAELGVHSVAYAFPKVKIITTAVDKSLDDFLHVIPGIGDFGDRYFGTDGSDGWSDEEDEEQPSYWHKRLWASVTEKKQKLLENFCYCASFSSGKD